MSFYAGLIVITAACLQICGVSSFCKGTLRCEFGGRFRSISLGKSLGGFGTFRALGPKANPCRVVKYKFLLSLWGDEVYKNLQTDVVL